MSNIKEIVSNLDRFVAEAESDNVEVLIKSIIGISACLYSMSVYLAKAELEEHTQKDLLDFTKEQIIKEVVNGRRPKEKTTVDNAKAIATEETQEYLEAYNKARYNARVLNLKRLSANTFIDVARSKISQAKREADSAREVV